MVVTTSSSRIIEVVDRALEALEIFLRVNGDTLEGLTDINEHRRKEVGEGGSVSWVVAWNKGECHKYELTKNTFSMVIC